MRKAGPDNHRKFTYEQIAATFVYDPEEGQLSRRLIRGRVRELTMAREDRDGFTAPAQVGFRGYLITCTHIAFMLMRHRWPSPDHVIDHRDGNQLNCRWANLREATPSQSMMNREYLGRPGQDDSEGLERGVRRVGNRYEVRQFVEGKQVRLGSFATKDEANAVARKARAELQRKWSIEASRGEPEL
jgi:hypothetical protein